MSQSSSPNLTGRGTNTNDPNTSQTINILISTTTGTQFDITVESLNTIEHLKKVISKKLKVNKDKIVLLFKERELQDGTLIMDNGIVEGSKVVLTPNVETGLLTQRAENTVMQALESLNDSQVNDFLSGKSPLNLSVRLGDHMMLIQLQLSTINPTSVQNTGAAASQTSMPQSQNKTSSHHLNAGASSSKMSKSSRKNVLDLTPESNPRVVFESPQKFDLFNNSNCHSNQSTNTRSPTDNFEHNDLNSYLIKDVDNLESIVKSLSNFIDQGEDLKQARLSDPVLEQSPIKSLSNLVSNSITESKTPILQQQQPVASNSASSSSTMNCTSDQIDPNLFHSITSCLCKRLDSECTRTSDPLYNPSCFSGHNHHQSASRYEHVPQNQPSTSTHGSKSSSSPSTFLHKTSHNPITKSKSRHGSSSSSFKKHHSTNTILPFNDNHQSSSSLNATTPLLPHQTHTPPSDDNTTSDDNTLEPIAGTMDNPALAEASRNLTQTLRKLSKKVFPRGDGSRRITSGAVIESMKHHGKGIYSGTFSGTLNPALQDKHGRPKRDISTIIHILNDLLSAAPQCTRSGAKIYFEPTTSTSTGSQSAPVSPVAKSSPTRRSSHHQGESSCVRCPSSSVAATSASASSSSSSSSKMIRLSEDYSGTIKSSTHRRRTNACHLPHNHHHHHHQSMSTSSNPSISSTSNKVPSSLELENSKTKYKLDQLRLVMQQKKERREARKLKNLPYHNATRDVSVANVSPTTTTTITALASPSTTQPPAASPNSNVESIIEEVDTVA